MKICLHDTAVAINDGPRAVIGRLCNKLIALGATLVVLPTRDFAGDDGYFAELDLPADQRARYEIACACIRAQARWYDYPVYIERGRMRIRGAEVHNSITIDRFARYLDPDYKRYRTTPQNNYTDSMPAISIKLPKELCK